MGALGKGVFFIVMEAENTSQLVLGLSFSLYDVALKFLSSRVHVQRVCDK